MRARAEPMSGIATSIVALLVPVAIGVLLARLRFFADPAAAMDALNRLALHVAFPPLVVASLAAPSASIGHGWAFYAIIPLALALALAVVRLAVPRELAGTVALVVAFGNTAYLGLPFVGALLGPAALATAAVAVALHVALAMTAGPVLLLRWSGDGASLGVLAKLLRQPLVWSPLVGVGLRALPDSVREPARAVLAPLGAMASPVSMVLLGLYLAVHRRDLRVDRSTLTHVAARLVLAPALTVPLVWGARALGLLELEAGRVLVVLAAMPVAITTFSIALEHGRGPERVAAAIVASTLAAVVTLPLACALAFLLT